MELDPVCISLVHQYLESTNSALADQFKDKYQPQKTNVDVKEVLCKWKEEQKERDPMPIIAGRIDGFWGQNGFNDCSPSFSGCPFSIVSTLCSSEASSRRIGQAIKMFGNQLISAQYISRLNGNEDGI